MKKFLDNRGQVLFIATMILALASAYIVTMVGKSVHSTRINKVINDQSQALWIAEAGTQKAVWCLNQTVGTNCGGTYGASYVGETGVSLNGGSFTTTVAGTSSPKTITSVATSAGGKTKRVVVQASTAPQTVTQSGFDFALQVTGGGVTLDNNAQVNNGPLHSGANVICDNGAMMEKDVFVSLAGGKIDNCGNIRDAHADKVLNSQVNRDAYYKNDPADIAGTTVGGTKYPSSPTPEPETLPPLDLDFWHTAAEVGGTISGNYTPPNGSTLGPKKINGNLTIDSTVTITGPIWIAGNLTLNNGAVLRLSSDFGEASGILLADNPADRANSGLIVINNNAIVQRSMIDGSYMFFVSTNTRTQDGSPAINVGNNVDGGVFFAPNGAVTINNNGFVTAVAGYRVRLTNNTAVNYDDTGITPVSMKIATTQAGAWHKTPGTRSE